MLAQAGQLLGIGCQPVAGHQIGRQLPAVGAIDSQHHRFAHRRMLVQAGLDFTQLDAQATDLHLVVGAPEVLDHPIGAIACHVTAAVQARTALGTGVERIRHKTLGRQRRLVEVATRQRITADVQLAPGKRRHTQRIAQHMQAHVGHGAADGYRARLQLRRQHVEGAVDGGFRGAVQVDQLPAPAGSNLLAQRGGQRFAAHRQQPYRVHLARAAIRQQGMQQ